MDGAGAAPNVLLVEDESSLCEILRRNMEARGYRVHAVGTAGAALAALQTEHPAVLLLDINLPDGSGWDVLRALRAQGRRVPTIIVSAVRCSQTRLDEFRPDVYLPKPFPLNALLEAVKRLAPRSGAPTGAIANGAPSNGATADGAATPRAEFDGVQGGDKRAPAGASDTEPQKEDGPMALWRSAQDQPRAARGTAGRTVWRVPRTHHTRGVTDPNERAYLARMAAAGASSRPQAQASRPAQNEPPRSLTLQEIMNGALCDVVADPVGSIVRASVAGATPAGVAKLHAAAEARGLRARSAVSPSLHVGWVTIERSATGQAGTPAHGGGDERHPVADTQDTTLGERHAKSDNGYPLHRADARFSRALAWLRRGLRALVMPVSLASTDEEWEHGVDA